MGRATIHYAPVSDGWRASVARSFADGLVLGDAVSQTNTPAGTYHATDKTSQPPPSPPPTIPAVGASIIDPNFGHRIFRLTSTNYSVSYSYWPALNADNSMLYCLERTSGNTVLLDLEWHDTYVTITNEREACPNDNFVQDGFTWDRSDPLTAYALSTDGKIYIIDFSSGQGVSSVLKDIGGDSRFSSVFGSNFIMQLRTDLAQQRFTASVNNSSNQNYPLGAVVWDRNTDDLWTLDTTSVWNEGNGLGYDECNLNWGGNICLVLGGDRDWYTWDLDTDTATYHTTESPAHCDAGDDVQWLAGDPGLDYAELVSPYTNDVSVFQWVDPASRVPAEEHTSTLAFDNFAYGSVFSAAGTNGDPSQPGTDEIWRVGFDGIAYRRFCHHFSTADTYPLQVHASVAYNGDYVVFNSDWMVGDGVPGVFAVKTTPEGGWPSVPITGISVDTGTLNRVSNGTDIWPTTVGADGNIYTAGGDGDGFDGVDTRGLDVDKITGTPASYSGTELMHKVDCLPVGLISIGGVLYLVEQERGDIDGDGHNYCNVRIGKSTDHGATWSCLVNATTGWTYTYPDGFPSLSWVQAGPDFVNAPDDYVYGISESFFAPTQVGDGVDLLRCPKDADLRDPSNHEYFAGLDGSNNATWTSTIGSRSPTFTRTGAVHWGPTMAFNHILQRYILTIFTDSSGTAAFYEAAHPWGPWTQIGSDIASFGGDTEEKFCVQFVNRSNWLSSDGLTWWFVVSGTGAWDSFNVLKATLTV